MQARSKYIYYYKYWKSWARAEVFSHRVAQLQNNRCGIKYLRNSYGKINDAACNYDNFYRRLPRFTARALRDIHYSQCVCCTFTFAFARESFLWILQRKIKLIFTFECVM